MRQHARFKTEHPDCVLFFRMGDFYEMFGEDARLVHRVLGLTLTQRTEGIPMAGVPHHALDGYLQKMIGQGYRVAVCDQVQDPRDAQGVVDRAVTRVLTPGTLVDEALLEESRANQVAAIAFLGDDSRSAAVLALAEVSTGRFHVLDLPTDRIRDELARVRPTELMFAEPADGSVPDRVRVLSDTVGCALTARPGWSFRHRDARDLLLEHFRVSTLAGFGLADDDPAIGPAGALLRYLYETQAPVAASAREHLRHIQPPRREARDDSLLIDETSLRSLEIERTMRSGQTEGSLLSILQRCSTPMGKRLLRQWLCFPLCNVAAIDARLSAVATLVADPDLAAALGEHVAAVQDVARIVGRVSMGRATPRDLVALGRSVSRLPEISGLLEGIPAFARLRDRLSTVAGPLVPLVRSILDRCVDSPPPHLREGDVFRDGVDTELDDARRHQHHANTWLADYQKRMTVETGIRTLKVGFNRVFGYYLEVTHAQAGRVPPSFSRKQTLKNAERYVTPELKEFEDKVTTAERRAIERERVLFEELRGQAAGHAGPLSTFAETVAEIDVLACFAQVAVTYGYVRPQIVEEPVLEIRQGRHPVLDRGLGERFVPNDCVLGMDGGSEAPPHDGAEGSGATLALITGPNMAGKSTAIRQAAIIALLAHTGCFVPAESATIGLVDRIFTRIGASDELHRGQSTFMLEMTETANILNHATDRSLVILDEIGRGTSTLDGLALAWAIAEAIASRRCRALFATHYHELTSLAERLANVTNLHVSVREWGDEIIFLYRLRPGRTDRSYGIHVARIAGLPRSTVERATEILASLAVHTDDPEIPAAGTAAAAPPLGGQYDLFAGSVEHPVASELREVNLNTMTPLEAFELLRELQRKVE